jgi:hypothetical protein
MLQQYVFNFAISTAQIRDYVTLNLMEGICIYCERGRIRQEAVAYFKLLYRKSLRVTKGIYGHIRQGNDCDSA